ncbi:YSIRK-type signal peptide-containing protein [Lactobacillus sp. Marseille-P7033]|nr:YSIRK-type signal peptide-containing protein [Lactobacillus sp. Marseille-P7033]
MLSKNNQKEQFYKQEPKKQRFAIKKLTVGVASVLIGFTFMGISNSANADQVNPDSGAGDGTTSETPQSATAINSGSAVLSTAASAAPASTSASAASQAGPQTPVADAYEKIVAANAAKAVSQNSPANVSQSSAALQAAQLYGASFAQTPATTQVTGQTESVANYSDFLNALGDHSVSTITLTGDIDGSTASGNYDTINTEGTARSVTIDGQGKYGFKLGGRYIYLTTNTEKNTSTPWNITFANLTHIQAQNNNYGLLCVYTNDPSKSSVNFHNVNVDADTTALTGTNGSYGATNVTFSGNNTINGTLTGSNVLVAADNLVVADGTTTVTPTANNATQATSFSVAGNAVVNSGATLNVNSTASNVAGITFTGSAGNQTIDNSSAGVLDLQPTATVSMNLGAGKSMAVMNASDINLQSSSKLMVNTKMDTTGFRALAPIELDSKGRVANSTFRIGENATLSVVREGVANSDSPLVSMGPNDGTGQSYLFEVNGGSVNLQDSAYSTYLPSTYSLSKSKYTNGWAGLLTMWGSSSQDYINFNNAKLINLQRTADGKPGYLIRTDAAGDANHNSHIRINSEDTDYVTPLTMITAGSTTPTTWAIKYLNNKSQGGDFAYAFRSSKGAWNTAGSEYMNNSVNDNNGGVNEVILAANPNEKGSVSFNNGQVIGGEASQSLNNFINHFSWWNGSGVKFGSDLQLENQYNASYSHVDVQQGQTVTVTPSFTDKDGKNATMPTGTQFTAGDNMPTWATVNPTTGEVTLKPGTDVKIGAYNLPVKVTYSDTTSQTVNVPVVVTNADQNVTWGQNGAVVVTVNPDIAAHETTANSQVLLAPDAVSSVQGYKLNNGQLSTTPTNITVAPADVSWTTVPSTNVNNATAAGKQIEDNSVKINFANNDTVKDILGDKTSVTSSKFTIDAKGAGAKDVKTPVNVQLGTDLTGEQFSQLVDSNIPPKSIASTAWETKPVKGQDATIKITFTDDDANGQPTYLNVTIPAKNLNVIGDNDNYEPTTQPITTPEGTVPEAPTAITNKNTDNVPAGQKKLPEGTQITWTNPDQAKKDVEVPGTHDETITVTYPDGTKDTVTTTVTVNAAPAVQPITVDLNGTPDPAKGITNLNQGDGYPTSVTWNQTPDTTTPGVYNPTATVSYKTGNPVQVTIPVIVINPANQNVVANEKGAVIVTTNPVETHKTNTANEADAQQAVKNIAVYTYDNDGKLVQNTDASTTNTAAWTNKDFTTAIGKNGSTATVKDQAENVTVSFANGSDAAKITSTIEAPTTVTLNGATAIEGVTATHGLENTLPQPSSLVNVSDLTEANNSAVKNVSWGDGTPSVDKLGTVDTSVTINFTDGSSLSVPVSFNVVNNDADKADPQSKNISTDEGVVPEAPTAITNKDDLPQGTVITWTNPGQVTDDVKTPGTHTESITVTYPDGTKDTVATDVTVNQAPQTQPISTGVGDEPNATETITNLRNNVPGYPTSATWKTAPDTKTPGDKTGVVTVTYPDGTTKDVPVKVTVDEAPQVKEISTKVGSTPVATDTIANLRNNVPGYPTSATWKTAPDTSKVGTTTGEVTVTYPDGTTKDVTVKVTVTDYANQYPVNYGNLNVERPTTAQSATNSIDPTTAENMPTGAITGYQEGTFTAPTGVSVTVDPVTGKVTATVNQDADLGSIEVPVEVTYRDGTTATVNVPVSITGSKVNPGDVVYYGNQTMTVFSDNLTNVHKTTGDSTPAAAASQFEIITFYTDWDKDGNKVSDYKTQVVYKLNADGTKYVNANDASDSFDANVVNYAWQNGFAPNTNTTSFANGAADTLYKLANGEVNPAEQTPAGQPLGGNSKYRYNISISDRAVLNKLGLSMKGYHSWANVYYNFYGATGKTDVPVNYDSEVPTDSAALEDYLASNGISGQTFTNGNVTGIKWASMPGANGKFNATNMNGTIEFTFDNGTKLDVPVSFKTGSYVPTSDSKVNDDTNLYVTRTIEFNVPAGQNAIAPITQTVHYVRDGYHNVNAQGEDTSAITWNAWQLADGQTAEWAAQPVATINDEATGAVYTPQIAGKTVTEVPAETVTENTKDTTVTVDYAETTTPIKWDATKDNMTKDVTRTITVNYPAGITGDQPAPQVVHFTREDAKGNAGYIVNGKTEMNAWHLVGSDAATGTWTAYTAPTEKGYTANPASVEQVTVTPTTVDNNVTINYNRNEDTPIPFDASRDTHDVTRTITINYPAGQEGQQPAPQTVVFTREDAKGNAGYTDAVTGEPKWNAWHVQDSDATTGTWAAYPVNTITDAATGAVYTPQVNGKTVTEVPAETVTENTKDTTVTVDYAETTTPIKWDATKDNMTKDVTRTITVNYPAGITGDQPAPQVVHFTREDAKGNAGYIVNGKTEMNAWHLVGSDAATGTWSEFTSPTVKGYTADPAKVAATDVTPETSSTTATINYTANAQSAQINFVDQTNNKTISTQTIDGQTGETVKVTLDVPANWEIIGGQEVPSTITFGSDGVPTQTVYIKHKTENVNDDTQRTVSYKVVEDFNGTQKTVMNDNATFTRTATKDLVTGDVTYGEWKTNNNVNIDAINVAQPGYTAQVDGQNLANNEVPAVTLTPDFGKKTVTVTYVANEQSVSVTYVDQNGQEITMPDGQPVAGSHYEVTGKTGETVDTNVEKNVPANWQLVPGETIPATITFGSTPASPIKVVVEHGTKDVTNDPSQEKQTHRTVEYKVVEDFNGSQTPVFAQPVSFARTATEDLVTGAVTYGSWTPASRDISAINVAQPGYTAQVNGKSLVNNEVPATVITPDSADQVITVTYLANEQSTKINYVNNADHNDIVGTQTVTGKTGEEVKVTLDIPAGWQAVSGQTVPSSITFGSDGAPTHTVYVEHKIDTTDGRNDQNNKDVYRVVTRTITVNFPDQAPQSATETLAFYRIKSYDEVTKQTTYTAWMSNMNDGATSFQKVEVPTIGGYSISATNATLENENGQEYVPAQSGLNNGTPVDSYTVEVNYTAQEQQTQINYVNNANHNDVVATQTVSGKTGENVKVDLNVPANWQVVGGQKVPSSITFGSTPTKAITVYIEHQTKEIKNDETQKTVSYQVVEDFNGTKTVVKNAQFTFERPAIEDLVTGEITYGNWGPDQVAPKVSVAQPGYTAQLNGKDLVNNVVPETTITPTTPNQVITVTYVANEQSAQINFVNNADHNDVVATQTVNGKTGENVKVTLDVPTGWQIVGGQTVPSSIAFGSTPVTPTTVYVEQKVDKTDGRDDKTNTDLYRVVTRTIIVNIPGQPAQSYPESLDFYRIKSYNEVTKKTTYSPWTSNMTNGETSFQQVTVPTLGEYTISATGVTLEHENGNVVVPAQSALFNGVPVPSYTITINYIANEQTVTINYVDNSDHKTVVGIQTINGKTGEQVPVTLDVPANWQIVSGQQVPQSITFGTTPISDKTVYVEHKTKDVTNDPSQKNKTHKVIDYKVVEDFNGTQTTAATATVTFDRTATEDLVTGDVTYGKWNVESQTVPAVNVAKAGYTAQVNGKTLANGEVPAATFTPESESQTVTVTYTANEQSAKINFVDNNNHNQIVGTQTVNGKTGENVKVTLDVPAGWQVVSGQNVPSSIAFGSTPVSDTTVYVEHKIDTTDGRNDKTNTDVYRTVTRTIVVNVPGQKEQTSSETLAFYRIKSVDEVTKNVSYTAWTSNMDNGATAFTAVSIPTIKGYMASATGANLQTINGQEYVPVQSALKNGTPVDSYTVTVNYAKDGNVPVPFDPTNQDMYREVTRTINVTDPVTGETTTSVQTAKFTREDASGNAGYTDPVTGKTTMNPWTPAEQGLSAVNVERLQGYTANVDGNTGAVTVTPDSQDMTVNITYTANKPVGKDIETPQGTVPPAKDGIKNVPDLPTDTTYTWKTTPDVTKPGTTDATIVVTYPDGTKTEVPVQVVVTETTPTPTTTDADKYTPSYPDVVTTPGKTTTTDVTYDGNKPTGGVTYQITKGATIPDWVNVDPTTGTITTTVPTDAGTQVVNIPVTVTYEDGSSDETTATVVVVATKDHVDSPTSPKDTIKDPENLPTGTTVEWTPGEQPDPTKRGDQPTSVTVTVPGHEPVNIPTTVNYGNPTDADKYTPEGQPVKTIAGTVPNANKGIANLGDLPQGTTVDWSTPDQISKDVKTPGTYNEGITVTYPDGSKDTLTVTVTVTTPVKPEGTKTAPIGQNITINKGAAVPDPSTAIANKGEMPDGTQYDWKNVPDTNKTGKQQATVVVTYPDGTKTSVTITINVVSDADKYEPQTQPITVPTGVLPDPAEGIKNKADLPDGTKYTWTNPDKVAQDVKRNGSHTETVTVTYPDGSQDKVTVTVTAITPQGQNIHTPQGVLPNPGDAIANKGQLPDGTTYTWQQQPDVSTVGDHTGVVKVTFPDGSTYDVTVNVHVDANANGETTVKSNDTKTNVGEVAKTTADSATATNENTAATTANDQQLAGNKETTTKKGNGAAQDAKKLPQTGNDAEKGSTLAGLGLASLAGTLGMATRKKRKHEKND